jgi:hypothetical protein
MISWVIRKQGSIAQSTTKAEYIAKQVMLARKQYGSENWFSGLFGDKLVMTMVHSDNQSCIKLTENPVFHDRSKNIDMRYHYIQHLVQRKIVKLQYIATSEQVVDILTKPLTSRYFLQLRGKIGVAENDSLAEREC